MQDFPVGVDGNGNFANDYRPNAGAGLGDYEFWCRDAGGRESNHVHFEIRAR